MIGVCCRTVGTHKTHYEGEGFVFELQPLSLAATSPARYAAAVSIAAAQQQPYNGSSCAVSCRLCVGRHIAVCSCFVHLTISEQDNVTTLIDSGSVGVMANSEVLL